MTNHRNTKLINPSPCPFCDEMTPSPVINDGKPTTTSCGNCGTRRTIQVSVDFGGDSPKPVSLDGKPWN